MLINAGDGTSKIEQGVRFYGRLGTAKRRPLEPAQTKIDGGSVQGVHRGVQTNVQSLVGVEHSSTGEQPHSQGLIYMPVAQA